MKTYSETRAIALVDLEDPDDFFDLFRKTYRTEFHLWDIDGGYFSLYFHVESAYIGDFWLNKVVYSNNERNVGQTIYVDGSPNEAAAFALVGLTRLLKAHEQHISGLEKVSSFTLSDDGFYKLRQKGKKIFS